MNTYEISYDYKGYLEVIDFNADDMLSAIGQFFENTNGKLSDIIKIEVKQ